MLATFYSSYLIISLLVRKILHSHFTKSGLSQKNCFSNVHVYEYIWRCACVFSYRCVTKFGNLYEKMHARAKYCWQMWNITMDHVFDVHIYYPAEKQFLLFSHTHIYFSLILISCALHFVICAMYVVAFVLCRKLCLTIVSSGLIYHNIWVELPD